MDSNISSSSSPVSRLSLAAMGVREDGTLTVTSSTFDVDVTLMEDEDGGIVGGGDDEVIVSRWSISKSSLTPPPPPVVNVPLELLFIVVVLAGAGTVSSSTL